jgi:hypothetical protein
MEELNTAYVDFLSGHAKIKRDFFAKMRSAEGNMARKWTRSFIL